MGQALPEPYKHNLEATRDLSKRARQRNEGSRLYRCVERQAGPSLAGVGEIYPSRKTCLCENGVIFKEEFWGDLLLPRDLPVNPVPKT